MPNEYTKHRVFSEENGPNGGSGTSLFSVKKSLIASQINTGNSIPINFGISVPTGKFLQVIGASFNYLQGDGLQTFTMVSLSTATKLGFQATLSMRFTTTIWEGFTIGGGGDSLIDAQDLMVSFDVDSGVGTGSADIYLIYMLIDK